MSRTAGQYQIPARICADQRGITGLETAIFLIAFAVVASVFAFAVLNTGLLSSRKSEQAALGRLEETSATLTIRGDVISSANTGKTAIDTVRFNLDPAFTSSESVDLSTTGTVLNYLAESQDIDYENPQSFDGDADTPACSWSTSWLIGSGDIVESGEQVEVTVTLTDLTPLLTEKTEFSIQVKPIKGAIVIVSKTLLGELKGVTPLR
ncbi:MAG: archaellin/type IV pilin N-terminal domain-containing protein [Chloroflexota bacterium]|nr:archaellin/type IV pilin N-terminal domain-containing protein [Chloroflexota bacterium]